MRSILLWLFGFASLFFALLIFLPESEPEVAVVIQNGIRTSHAELSNDSLPESIHIDVPFTSQSPYADWNPPYDEACEEASLLMVERYLSNKDLPVDEADMEIRNLTTWIEYQNLPIDMTIEQLAAVAEEYYSLQSTILDNPSLEDIRMQIASGNPVIVPLAGQRIGNPYFSGDGPPYHMLVITGYTPTTFITNDPGTRRGEDFEYPFANIMNHIHNWNGSKETIETGAAVALVLQKTNQLPSSLETEAE